MDETAHARAAFRDGIGDISPEPLYSRLEEVLKTSSMTPGALTVLTATALGESIEGDSAARRSAGIQMSYEGLRLSRELIRTDPWAEGDTDAGDIDVIAAEVLVARGFEYLAHTVVADDVVEAVRRFGRDQTRREEPDADRPAIDRGLEKDFIRIAVVAGGDIALQTVTEDVTVLADELADELGIEPMPDAETALEGLEDRITAAIAGTEATPTGDFSCSRGR